MNMKIVFRTFLFMVTVVGLIILTAPVEAKQGGVALPRVAADDVMDTYFVHLLVLGNFTYEMDAEGTDTWKVYNGRLPFTGDCEDFAFTMQRVVGAGSVYKAYLSDAEDAEGTQPTPNHAVYVYGGLVWELEGTILSIADYEKLGHHIFFRTGDITPDL